MSAGKGTFSQQQIEDLRNQLRGLPPTPGPEEVVGGGGYRFNFFPFDRSYQRLGLILGISASAVGAFFGARYLLSDSASAPVLNADSGLTAGEFDVNKSIDGLESDRIGTLKKNIKVTLHQCPRGYNTPCISPFSLKLETFLRVANIPYEVKYTAQPHAKNSPWLTVGDHDIVDAHECITFLCNTFGTILESGAKPSRLTASRLVGIQLDNHIYWGIALWRWVYDKGASLKDIQPLSPQALTVISSVSESVRRAAWYHGLGRLPYEKVLEIITTDLADLSAALGRHKYFLGDHPGEIDCNAFAMLSQMLWNMPSSPFEKELSKYDNLVQFVYRMRDTYWPDWQELLHKPGEHKIPEKFYYPTSEFHMSMTGLKNSEVTEPASTISTEPPQATENFEDKSEPCALVNTPSLNQNSIRARSMPVKANEKKVAISGNKASTEKVQSPLVPQRATQVPSKPPPGIAPQLGQQNVRLSNIPIASNPMPGNVQQPQGNKLASMSQSQLNSIQTMLNDLNKQLGFAKEGQNQQNSFNNNYPGGPQPQYPSYDPRAPTQGRPTPGFYPTASNPGIVPSGVYNQQPTSLYYATNLTPNPSPYPYPPFYPHQPM